MEDATNTYLNREKGLHEYASPRLMLVQAAEKMVRQRRAREASGDRERWEHYLGMRLRDRAASSAETSEEEIGAAKASGSRK